VVQLPAGFLRLPATAAADSDGAVAARAGPLDAFRHHRAAAGRLAANGAGDRLNGISSGPSAVSPAPSNGKERPASAAVPPGRPGGSGSARAQSSGAVKGELAAAQPKANDQRQDNRSSGPPMVVISPAGEQQVCTTGFRV